MSIRDKKTGSSVTLVGFSLSLFRSGTEKPSGITDGFRDQDAFLQAVTGSYRKNPMGGRGMKLFWMGRFYFQGSGLIFNHEEHKGHKDTGARAEDSATK
jgi:hypothetical protein